MARFLSGLAKKMLPRAIVLNKFGGAKIENLATDVFFFTEDYHWCNYKVGLSTNTVNWACFKEDVQKTVQSLFISRVPSEAIQESTLAIDKI